MRTIKKQNGNILSMGARLAGVATLGITSLLLVTGLTLISAPAANAATTTPVALAPAAVGVSYTSNTLTVATSGTWAVTSGSLPAGLKLSSPLPAATNTISGIPTADGSYAFTITVTDAVTPATYTLSYTLTVTGIGSGALYTPILVNTAYKSATLTTATAGTWAVTSGALPTGLVLTSTTSSTTDNITGTPTVNGTYIFTITVTDSTTPVTYLQAYTLVVASQIPQPSLQVLASLAVLANPITLITTGGSGTSAPTFSVVNGTATGCTISGTELTAITVGTCIVTATEAATSTLLVVKSSATTFTFNANPVAPPAVKAIKVKGTALIGKVETLIIMGKNFSRPLTVKTSNLGSRVAVKKVSGSALTIRITATKKSHKGVALLTVSEGSNSTKVKYLTK